MATINRKLEIEVTLPASFGEGWDYYVQHFYPYNHAFAGSYLKTDDENHAENALWQILYDERVEDANVCHYDDWIISVSLNNEKDIKWFENAILELEKAFPPRLNISEWHMIDEYFNRTVYWYDTEENPEGENVEYKNIDDLVAEWPCLSRCFSL